MWDDFVTASDDAWLFHLSDWMAIESESSRSLAFFIEENGKTVGIFPLYLGQRRYAGLVPSRILHTGRGRSGPAFDPALGPKRRVAIAREMFSHVDALARQHRVDRLEVRLPTLAPNHLPPRRAHDDPLSRYDAFVPLKYGRDLGATTIVDKIVPLDRPQDDLFSEVDDDCRKAIRKAKKSGVTVTPATARADMADYHRLHALTYGRSGAAQLPLAHFESLWDRFASNRRMVVLFAEHEGRRIGAMIILMFRDAATYWAGASDWAYQQMRPNNLLMWEAILWAQQHPCRWFELGPLFPFGDASAKATRIGRFKDQFGGQRFALYEGAKNYRSARIAALEGVDAAAAAIRRLATSRRSSSP